jgi:hypothetical protein
MSPVPTIATRGALASALALLALAAAGCAGSKSPAVASLTTTSSTTASTTTRSGATASRAALARCFTQHGFQAYVGGAGSSSGSGLDFAGVTIPGNVDPASPQFQAARQACSKYMPGGGPPALTPAQKAASLRGLTRFAACMRTHGVSDFPDPDSSGIFPLGSIRQLNADTPTFQKADKACEGLMAKVGPRISFG